jgi:hypothetical protein
MATTWRSPLKKKRSKKSVVFHCAEFTRSGGCSTCNGCVPTRTRLLAGIAEKPALDAEGSLRSAQRSWREASPQSSLQGSLRSCSSHPADETVLAAGLAAELFLASCG